MRLRKRQRLILLTTAVTLLAGAGLLIMAALSDSVAFFVTPSDIAQGKVDPAKRFRLGGLVVPGSVERGGEGGLVRFALSDQVHEVPVSYRGILPDLFREGQGIVAQGSLDGQGVFVAAEVLAKHDEAYMPPEVAAALKQAGVFQPAAQAGELEAPAGAER